MTWELVHDVAFDRVRRMRITDGWLYQVEMSSVMVSQAHDTPDVVVSGWHPPVFVPFKDGK